MSENDKNGKKKRTHPGSQADNLPPSLKPQVSRDHAANARPEHLLLVIQQHGSVVVEPNIGTVWPADGFPRAHYNGASYVSATDFDSIYRCLGGGRNRACFLDDNDDFIAD